MIHTQHEDFVLFMNKLSIRGFSFPDIALCQRSLQCSFLGYSLVLLILLSCFLNSPVILCVDFIHDHIVSFFTDFSMTKIPSSEYKGNVYIHHSIFFLFLFSFKCWLHFSYHSFRRIMTSLFFVLYILLSQT